MPSWDGELYQMMSDALCDVHIVARGEDRVEPLARAFVGLIERRGVDIGTLTLQQAESVISAVTEVYGHCRWAGAADVALRELRRLGFVFSRVSHVYQV